MFDMGPGYYDRPYGPGPYRDYGPVPPPYPPPRPMLEPYDYYDDEFDRFDGYTREGELV